MAESEYDSVFVPSLFKPTGFLPIAKHQQSLLYMVESHQVTIVIGQTGSGKSTQIPQFLEKGGWCQDRKAIAITQVGHVFHCPVSKIYLTQTIIFFKKKMKMK